MLIRLHNQVISSYVPPAQATLERHLPTHLGPQISHLIRARPLSVSMGTAIRWLKYEIGNTDSELAVEDVSGLLAGRKRLWLI